MRQRRRRWWPLAVHSEEQRVTLGSYALPPTLLMVTPAVPEHFQGPEVMGISHLSRCGNPQSPFKTWGGGGVAGRHGAGGWKYSSEYLLGMLTILSLMPRTAGGRVGDVKEKKKNTKMSSMFPKYTFKKKF